MLERLHAGWKLQTVPALYDSRLFESPVMMEDSPAQEPAIKRPSRSRGCTLVYPAVSFVRANERLCATPWCLRDYLAQVVRREDECITARAAIETAPNLKQSAKNIKKEKELSLEYVVLEADTIFTKEKALLLSLQIISNDNILAGFNPILSKKCHKPLYHISMHALHLTSAASALKLRVCWPIGACRGVTMTLLPFHTHATEPSQPSPTLCV